MQDKIRAFLEVLFGSTEGYLNISTRDSSDGSWKQFFYRWPDETSKVTEFCAKHALSHDVYFAPHLLGARKIVKSNVIECAALWADLDELDPEELKIEPSILIQTSPGRTQAYWLLKEPVKPEIAEHATKAIAYHHSDNGADVSGWDLTQRLRVPMTYNHKYEPIKKVNVLDYNQQRYDLDVIKHLYSDNGTSKTISFKDVEEESAPTDLRDPEVIIEENKPRFNPQVIDLYSEEPDGEWSVPLWTLILSLFEADLSAEDVFSVAKASACNKYRRDGRPDSHLWSDVKRAQKKVEAENKYAPAELVRSNEVSDLLTEDERQVAANRNDFIQRYITWAKNQSDASWQYHQGAAFIVLSTLLSGGVTLPTSFGTILPNIWCMILADTTLTRKSTAMRLATDLINDVDPDGMLATDGSIEGLLTQLSTRPGRPSLFLRDEITGFMESVTKKDYYAGMLEMLTKLYDGERQKRVLKKEEIDVRSPNFIFFAGGIKSKMMEVVNQEHVISGFLPRFVFITAEADPTKIKPVGPPTESSTSERNVLIASLIGMYKKYRQSRDDESNKLVIHNVELTDEAWYLYNRYEHTMLTDALESDDSNILTPVMSRLANSGLKCATLIAAADCVNDDKVVVTPEILKRAFYFIEQWREYTLEVIANLGASKEEIKIQRAYELIDANPGIARTNVMRLMNFTSREGDSILSTLIDRGMIRTSKKGGAIRYESAIPY